MFVLRKFNIIKIPIFPKLLFNHIGIPYEKLLGILNILDLIKTFVWDPYAKVWKNNRKSGRKKSNGRLFLYQIETFYEGTAI